MKPKSSDRSEAWAPDLALAFQGSIDRASGVVRSCHANARPRRKAGTSINNSPREAFPRLAGRFIWFWHFSSTLPSFPRFNFRAVRYSLHQNLASTGCCTSNYSLSLISASSLLCESAVARPSCSPFSQRLEWPVLSLDHHNTFQQRPGRSWPGALRTTPIFSIHTAYFPSAARAQTSLPF
jgi:hypothetical protein